jgi:hypothetical protein
MQLAGGQRKTESLTMSSIHSGKETSRLEFNLVFCLAYPIFLVAVTLSRLMPRQSRWSVSDHDDGKSVFKVAKIATYNSIPFAFM